MTEYLEVVVPVVEKEAIRRVWRKMGCRCLRKPWAEPWSEGKRWYSYHFMVCPVAVATKAGVPT